MSSLKAKLLDSAISPVASLPPPKTQIAHIPAGQPLPEGARPIKVMLALPSGRTWEARTATCVAGLAAHAMTQGIQLGILNMEGSMITKQRNDLVQMAKDQNADYLFFIDTDMVIPVDSLTRLLRHDKDVVGATYNKRVAPYETLGKLKGDKPGDDELRKGGLREAELLPTGVLLIKMSVFDRIPWPWFFETYQWPGADGVAQIKEYLRHNYSTFAPEEALAELDNCPKLATWLNATHKIEAHDWKYFSEDLNFCRKLAKMGIPLWCDLSLSFEAVHLGTHSVTCSPPPRPTVLSPAVM